MKTTINIKCACKMATALCAALFVGTSVWAQPLPDVYNDNEIRKAFERLDALMITVERTVRYAAPAEVYDDIRSTWESLELLADCTQNEIRYRAPAEEPVIEAERMVADQSTETHARVYLTYYFTKII